MKVPLELADIVNLAGHPLEDKGYRERCKQTLDDTGVLTMPGFLVAEAVQAVLKEGLDHQDQAYFSTQTHNVYLTPSDPTYAPAHPRNRAVVSSKGCITDDVIPSGSPLKVLYQDMTFRNFLCMVLGETQLYEYADNLSSVNLHYAQSGQELGWHFDNSSFAITLMIQAPEHGGRFEYVSHVRDADAGEMSFDAVEQVLDGAVPTRALSMEPGDLVLFRGRNALHRVTPVEGDRTRVLVVLAYNTEPGIALSESARMTFYGRLN